MEIINLGSIIVYILHLYVIYNKYVYVCIQYVYNCIYYIISIINKDHHFPSIYMNIPPYRVSTTSLLSATTVTDLKLESPGSTRVEGTKHEES